MIPKLISIFLLLTSTQIFAQKHYDLEYMYISTLEYYFDSNQGNNIQLVVDTLVDSLPESLKGNRFIYYLHADRALLNQKSRSFNLFRISHKIINQDTVDINIGGWTANVKKGFFIRNGKLSFRKIELAAWCGGTMGYIPTKRFVILEKKMIEFTSAELIELKIKEREKRILNWKNKN